MRRAALILLAIPLMLGLMGSSCATRPDRPVPPVIPKVVEVEVTRYVEVPAELSRDCDEIAKREQTVDEAVRLANARGEALAECTERMRKIRALPLPAPTRTPAVTP